MTCNPEHLSLVIRLSDATVICPFHECSTGALTTCFSWWGRLLLLTMLIWMPSGQIGFYLQNKSSIFEWFQDDGFMVGYCDCGPEFKPVIWGIFGVFPFWQFNSTKNLFSFFLLPNARVHWGPGAANRLLVSRPLERSLASLQGMCSQKNESPAIVSFLKGLGIKSW